MKKVIETKLKAVRDKYLTRMMNICNCMGTKKEKKTAMDKWPKWGHLIVLQSNVECVHPLYLHTCAVRLHTYAHTEQGIKKNHPYRELVRASKMLSNHMLLNLLCMYYVYLCRCPEGI